MDTERFIMASHKHNLKNFIRHGTQARNPGPAPPTTADTNAHAHAVTDSAYDHQYEQYGKKHGNITIGAAQADLFAHAEYQAAQKEQAMQQLMEIQEQNSAVAHIAAEEPESGGKLFRCPSLERWILVEKMGNGAFGNVYRATDSLGELEEVAIKVVRKNELISNQRFDVFPHHVLIQGQRTAQLRAYDLSLSHAV
ncbi:hypothetical protein TWF506_009442 [Arthrobotrys conoides]|uniref:Protein kinase domain-containing protein n=1 Tax=Arthrobotrys conoides TaxID=74498 RepID=A0AAN8RRK4_9PEZI